MCPRVQLFRSGDQNTIGMRFVVNPVDVGQFLPRVDRLVKVVRRVGLYPSCLQSLNRSNEVGFILQGDTITNHFFPAQTRSFRDVRLLHENVLVPRV
jgi:hypothetical protein